MSNQQNKFLKNIFKILVSTSVVLFVVIIAIIADDINTNRKRQTKSEQMAKASSLTLKKPAVKLIPSHINIPSLLIDAEIIKVVTENNQIDMPSNAKQVGWYDHTSHPIFAGHSGWYDKRKVAFDGLKNIKIGDTILVEYVGGTTYEFRVNSVKVLPWNATLADMLKSNSKYDIQLITCTGNWNKANQSYEQRLIVNAIRVIK